MNVEELDREARDTRSANHTEAEAFDLYDSLDLLDTADDLLTDDGDALPDEVQAELEALAAAELDDGASALEAALAEAQREVARQRTLTRHAVARFRDAILATEPDLPPDLVRGESIEEVEESVATARNAIARIRERVAAERPRPFPVGAPARTVERPSPLSAHEKIAAGLQERLI